MLDQAYDIKRFQVRYGLTNREIAEICGCSLPTIQKWRSGEVATSGAAAQLMKLLDLTAKGDSGRLRRAIEGMAMMPAGTGPDSELVGVESRIDIEKLIAERRRDRELSDIVSRYRSVLESFGAPACRWLPDTTLTFVNEDYQNLFADKGEDLTGRKWIEFLPEEQRRFSAAIISDLVRRGEPEVAIHETTDARGRELCYEWRDMPIKNEKGEVVEVHSVANDVTELVQLRRQAEGNRQNFHAFMSLARDPVVLFDQTGLFVESNNSFGHLLESVSGAHGFDDLMPLAVATKFRRLLKRVSTNRTFRFQLQLGKRGYSMIGRHIGASGEGGQYLAILEEIGAVTGSPVTQVRLRNEVLVDAERAELAIDPELVQRIGKRMSEVGKRAGVDRVYVFSFDDKDAVFDNLFEWCAESVQSHIDELQGFPMSEYAWWVARIRENKWIQFEDTSKMPRGAFREREVLVAQNIRAIMVAPVIVDGVPAGFVGFDHNHTTRAWHEQEEQLLTSFKAEVETLFSKMRGI